jgi:hypothetical protein
MPIQPLPIDKDATDRPDWMMDDYVLSDSETIMAVRVDGATGLVEVNNHGWRADDIVYTHVVMTGVLEAIGLRLEEEGYVRDETAIGGWRRA